MLQMVTRMSMSVALSPVCRLWEKHTMNVGSISVWHDLSSYGCKQQWRIAVKTAGSGCWKQNPAGQNMLHIIWCPTPEYWPMRRWTACYSNNLVVTLPLSSPPEITCHPASAAPLAHTDCYQASNGYKHSACKLLNTSILLVSCWKLACHAVLNPERVKS